MSKTLWLASGVAVAIVGFLFLRTVESPSRVNRQEMTVASNDTKQIQDWHEFSPASEKFKVSFPVLPQHATESLVDPKTKETRQYDMYVSEKDNGTIFMISLITMLENSQAKINDEVLKNVIDDLVSTNPHSKIKSMKMGSYREYPAMDFSIESDKVNIDGKAFIVGNTLYLLTSVAKVEDYKSSEFDYFMNSFQLNDLQQGKIPTEAQSSSPK